jgi:hypothetical protein
MESLLNVEVSYCEFSRKSDEMVSPFSAYINEPKQLLTAFHILGLVIIADLFPLWHVTECPTPFGSKQDRRLHSSIM